MTVYIRAVSGQILTVVANVLVISLLSCVAVVLSPFSTKSTFLTYIAHQPLSDQIQMSFSGLSNKRYMLNQEPRRKQVRPVLTIACLAITGLFFTFLSTIVFQTSALQLRDRPVDNLNLVSTANMSKIFLQGTTNTLNYPVIDDSFLGTENKTDEKGTRAIKASEFWKKNTGNPPLKPYFSGEVYLTLGETNWMSIEGPQNTSTTLSMSIDGVSAEEIPSASLGVASVQVIDDSFPDVFSVPLVSGSSGGFNKEDTQSFVVDGESTMDLVQYSLLKMDSQVWGDSDNLELYYEYLEAQKPFVNDKGVSLFNHTYDYKTKKLYDKTQLEEDFQVGGSDPVRYAMLAGRNITLDTDDHQTYTITKRSAYREERGTTNFGTINFVECHFLLKITHLNKPANFHLSDTFKVKYSRGTNDSAGYKSLPFTPIYSTSKDDYLTLASFSGSKILYNTYLPETYIDAVPIIALLSIYAFLIFCCVAFSIYWNIGRFKNKAYSVPEEMMNYVFYNPVDNLSPMLNKVLGLNLSMVDGYDPHLGYNHVGLVSEEDGERIRAAEPDVPYGLIPGNGSTFTLRGREGKDA